MMWQSEIPEPLVNAIVKMYTDIEVSTSVGKVKQPQELSKAIILHSGNSEHNIQNLTLCSYFICAHNYFLWYFVDYSRVQVFVIMMRPCSRWRYKACG
jgi:hypothetical protein